MTDMTHPSLEHADEFGGLEHLVLPGQDPAILLGIYAGFFDELEPKNFMERMLVRDMAVETARAEYVRMAECAVHRLIQQEEAAETADEAKAEPSPGDAALAKAYIKHIALIACIVNLEQTLLHERDRLVHLYDVRSGTMKAYQDALASLAKYEPDADNG